VSLGVRGEKRLHTTGLDDRGSIPDRGNGGILPLRYRVETGSGTQPAFHQWVRGLFPRGQSDRGRESDHSPPCCAAAVKITRTIPPLPQYIFMVRYLIKHRHITLSKSKLTQDLPVFHWTLPTLVISPHNQTSLPPPQMYIASGTKFCGCRH
jgi:hypothetical protein